MLKIGGIYNTCMAYTYFIVVAKDKECLYYYLINKKFENISNSAFNFPHELFCFIKEILYHNEFEKFDKKN